DVISFSFCITFRAYCESMNAARTLSAPDFGKIIKCVFPRVKARRLGTRGNSKYCYSGIQRKKNVKPPTLPSLQIPSPSDKEKNNTNQGNGMNGGDKIEEDQTLSAACLLVCEWANKLLGRVFTTLIELARFLVGGSYVSSKSMAAFVVMSNTDNVAHPQINHIANSLFSPQKHEAPLIIPKRKQSQQQFQKKIPASRQQKQQSLTHAILSDSSGNQILPKSQVQIQPQQHSPLHKQQVHLQPKTSTGQIQLYQQTSSHSQLSGATPSTPSTGYQKMRPPTPSLMSPTGPNQGLPQTPSPFQSSPKFNAPGTPHNRPMTPSSSVNQSRQQSNTIEPTRFLFTPITNEQKPTKSETSPPTLRPTATHPGNQSHDWQSGGTNQSQLNEIPVSPNKQPRLSLQCTPSTPTRRPSSFPYPITSPRTPQRIANQQYVTSPPMMSPGTPRPIMNVQSPNIQQRNQELMMLQGQDGMGAIVNDAMAGMQRGNDASPTLQVTDQMIKQGCGPGPSRPCRYSTSSDTSTMPPTPLTQQQSFDYSSELDSICTANVTNAGQVPPQFQRSQSVPPLPQHTLLDKRFHPLTPQTDNRLQQTTPSPMETTNSNQHLNSLKELRNRVLHGDVNNNGSRTNENAAFTARRNLTTLLNAETDMNNSGNNQNLWTAEGFQTSQTGSSSSEEQEMEMLETNLNFSDASLPDLNTFDDATAEAVLRNICNNTSGVWPTTDVGSWNTQQPLQIMD
ncbi:hypothetical protein QZH41_011899, partial [Actinostola sp. cb2023]